MGLTSAIYTSVSALDAIGIGISNVGNNLANVNTDGYKGNRVLFSDVLNSISGPALPSQTGGGVEVQSVVTQFAQGTIRNTDNPLDFAITGNGFFMVEDTNKNNALYYTRAGSFSLNKNGSIVDPEGKILQGYLADASGNIGTTVANVTLQPDANGNFTTPASATTQATLIANLNAGDKLPAADWTASFSAASGPASASYNYSTAMSVIDSAGNSHTVTVYFLKTANAGGTWNTGNWKAYAVWDKGTPDQNGAIAIHNYQSQLITNMTFDTNGQPTSAMGPFSLALSWDPAWKALSPQTISLNFGSQNGTSTQYAAADSTVFQQRDGYAGGALTGLKMKQDGTLNGVYSNGQERAQAQICIAQFNAPSELRKTGDNLYMETTASGEDTEYAPDKGGAGSVVAYALEASNVDQAREFGEMIALQSAFGVNSTVMKSTNAMYTTLINIKS